MELYKDELSEAYFQTERKRLKITGPRVLAWDGIEISIPRKGVANMQDYTGSHEMVACRLAVILSRLPDNAGRREVWRAVSRPDVAEYCDVR